MSVGQAGGSIDWTPPTCASSIAHDFLRFHFRGAVPPKRIQNSSRRPAYGILHHLWAPSLHLFDSSCSARHQARTCCGLQTAATPACEASRELPNAYEATIRPPKLAPDARRHGFAPASLGSIQPRATGLAVRAAGKEAGGPRPRPTSGLFAADSHRVNPRVIFSKQRSLLNWNSSRDSLNSMELR